MSDSRHARGGSATSVSSLADFVKGYQQQGLKRALVFATPFAITAATKKVRGSR